MFRTILVATDLSEGAEPVLRHALELGRRLGARVVALHVSEPPYETRPLFTPLTEREGELYRSIAHREKEEARGKLEAAVARARGEHTEVTPEIRVVAGIPSDEIIREAGRVEAELIVVGTHGRRGISHALLGSIAERVVRTAPVPVLVVRATGK